MPHDTLPPNRTLKAYFTCCVCNSMEQTTSLNGNSSSVSHGIPYNLWKPKGSLVLNSTTLAPILSQMNPVHTLPSYCSNILLIYSSYPCIHLPPCVFFEFSYQKPAGIFLLSHACHMTSTLIHYDFITLRIFDKKYESLRSSSKVLSCLLLLPPTWSKTHSSALSSHTFSVHFPP